MYTNIQVKLINSLYTKYVVHNKLLITKGVKRFTKSDVLPNNS